MANHALEARDQPLGSRIQHITAPELHEQIGIEHSHADLCALQRSVVACALIGVVAVHELSWRSQEPLLVVAALCFRHQQNAKRSIVGRTGLLERLAEQRQRPLVEPARLVVSGPVDELDSGFEINIPGVEQRRNVSRVDHGGGHLLHAARGVGAPELGIERESTSMSGLALGAPRAQQLFSGDCRISLFPAADVEKHLPHFSIQPGPVLALGSMQNAGSVDLACESCDLITLVPAYAGPCRIPVLAKIDHRWRRCIAWPASGSVGGYIVEF